MIISFKKYLNESDKNDDIDDSWEIMDKPNKSNKPDIDRKSIKVSDVENNKNYKKMMQDRIQNKRQNKDIIKKKKKHLIPYDTKVDHDEMDKLEKSNPALYAALSSWN